MNLLGQTIQIDKGEAGVYRVSWVGENGPDSKLCVSDAELQDFLVDVGFLPEPTT